MVRIVFILQLLLISAIFSCRSDSMDPIIRYYDIDPDSTFNSIDHYTAGVYYPADSTDQGLFDLDRDGTMDIAVRMSHSYNSNCSSSNPGNIIYPIGEVVALRSDVALLFNSAQPTDHNLRYYSAGIYVTHSESVIWRSDYGKFHGRYSCNDVGAGSLYDQFVIFRIASGDSYRYGWLRVFKGYTMEPVVVKDYAIYSDLSFTTGDH